MKRIGIAVIFGLMMILLLSAPVKAAEFDHYDDSVEELRNSLSDDVKERMDAIGYNGFGDINSDVPDIRSVFSEVFRELAEQSAAPLSFAAAVTAVIMLSGLLEGYITSLRHTRMQDILSVVSSLLVVTGIMTPVCELIDSAVKVLNDTSSLMLIFIPIMIGIVTFTGHLSGAAGYYITMMTASQAVSQVSTHFLSPLLSAFFALSLTAGIGGRLKLKSICDMVFRFMKWSLTFLMSIYAAVLGLHSIVGSAGDRAASRAIKFTLSSFIPFIGASISEAYKTIRSSVDLLRSGVGVFVLTAIFLTFLPILLRVILWLLTVKTTHHIAQLMDSSSADAVLSSTSSALSLLLALLICVFTAFVISTSVLISIGGGSG